MKVLALAGFEAVYMFEKKLPAESLRHGAENAATSLKKAATRLLAFMQIKRKK